MALDDDNEDLSQLSQEQIGSNARIVSETITKSSLPRYITLKTYEEEDEPLSPTHANKENFLSPNRVGETQLVSPGLTPMRLAPSGTSPSRTGLSPRKKEQLGLSPNRALLDPRLSPMVSRHFDAELVDDVFELEKEKDQFEEEEKKKLQDWAKNVYVPACRSLLEHCSIDTVSTKQVQTYLRLLANTITFFCNEHQSQQEIRRISPSRSESTIMCLENKCTIDVFHTLILTK